MTGATACSCSVAMTITATTTITLTFLLLLELEAEVDVGLLLFVLLSCLMFLLLLLLLLCCCRGQVCWTSLHSGRSPHDGGQRFFTLALTRKSDGLSYHCSAFFSLLCLLFGSLLLLFSGHPSMTPSFLSRFAYCPPEGRRLHYCCRSRRHRHCEACCGGRVTCVGVSLLAACSSWQDKLLPPPPPCIILWPAPRWSPWLAGTVG